MHMLKNVLSSFRNGTPVVVYDGNDREAEADLMVHASHATPKMLKLLRQDAGGLICFATSGGIGKRMKLPYMAEILRSVNSPSLRKLAVSKTPYGDAPAFSISVNHKSTFTGISDDDRSRTIVSLSRLIAQGNGIAHALPKEFYSPGHVPLLFSRSITERQGHTELAVALCNLSNLPPAVAICEMLGDGKALSLEEAEKYSRKNKIPLIEGKEIVEAVLR